MTRTPMTFGEAAIGLLAEYGVDTIFGIPGVHTIELYRGMHRHGVRAVTPRHEQGAGFMADGYGRVTGRFGVCTLITGPGVLNAATPIAQAWHDSVPLLVLAATTESTLLNQGRGPLHDIPDQAGLLRPLTQDSRIITEPDELAQALADAIADWEIGRPRPVHLAIPRDLLAVRTGPITAAGAGAPRQPPAADGDRLQQAADLLASARRPVVIVGGGARRARDQVREVAELLDAPVITTGNARTLIPADHPLHVGTLLPFPATHEMLASADAVLAVGTEFSEVDLLYTGTPLPTLTGLIRIDIDPTQLSTPEPAVPLQGDAALNLTRLIARIAKADRAHPDGVRTDSGARRASQARSDLPLTPDSKEHLPWLEAIAATLPRDSIVAVDSTQLAYTAQHCLPPPERGWWLAPYGLGTLGPALPMAIGAAIGRPDHRALVIAGDGGVMFTLPELRTAVEEQVPLTLLVWDNGGYGEIRDSFDRAAAPRLGTDGTHGDLAAVATALGAHSHTVEDPSTLADALIESYQRPEPTVLVATTRTQKAQR